MAATQATPSRWRRGGLLPLGLGVLLLCVAAGCAGGEQAQAHVTVNMLDDFYGRDLTRVPVGTSVRFVNDGRNPHNAVDAKGAWTTPIDMRRGDAKLVRFSRPSASPPTAWRWRTSPPATR